ncbi:MAG: hypothetical protein QE263_01395 [Vampirovibrionales bacterium]|nr:hypothetical protein [Vampirovibrionales bacterium]
MIFIAPPRVSFSANFLTKFFISDQPVKGVISEQKEIPPSIEDHEDFYGSKVLGESKRLTTLTTNTDSETVYGFLLGNKSRTLVHHLNNLDPNAKGVGSALMDEFTTGVDPTKTVEIYALPDSRKFWEKIGFKESEDKDEGDMHMISTAGEVQNRINASKGNLEL